MYVKENKKPTAITDNIYRQNQQRQHRPLTVAVHLRVTPGGDRSGVAGGQDLRAHRGPTLVQGYSIGLLKQGVIRLVRIVWVCVWMPGPAHPVPVPVEHPTLTSTICP